MPLSRARAVTENMFDTRCCGLCTPAGLASCACIGPLDNAAMRAAMRWHSSLDRAGLWLMAMSGSLIGDVPGQRWMKLPPTAVSEMGRHGARDTVDMSDRSLGCAGVGWGGVGNHPASVHSTHCALHIRPRNDQPTDMNALAISEAPHQMQARERPTRIPANSARRPSYHGTSPVLVPGINVSDAVPEAAFSTALSTASSIFCSTLPKVRIRIFGMAHVSIVEQLPRHRGQVTMCTFSCCKASAIHSKPGPWNIKVIPVLMATARHIYIQHQYSREAAHKGRDVHIENESC